MAVVASMVASMASVVASMASVVASVASMASTASMRVDFDGSDGLDRVGHTLKWKKV